MFDLKFRIEQVMGPYPVTPEELTEHIIYVITEANYRVVEQAPGLVVFKPFGTMPVSNTEMPYYLSKGRFELVKIENEKVLRLTYNVSYVGQIYLACIAGLGVIMVGYFAAISSMIIVFSFYKFYRKIKHDAEKMLNYLVEVSS